MTDWYTKDKPDTIPPRVEAALRVIELAPRQFDKDWDKTLDRARAIVDDYLNSGNEPQKASEQ